MVLSNSTVRLSLRVVRSPTIRSYNGFGCSGKNISPPLGWSGAPSATQSFALTVFDPDARARAGGTGSIYDIPASVTELPQGAGDPGGKMPAGAVQVRTDFGTAGYGGPCPPAGNKPHRYIFTVYALKAARLDVPAGTSAARAGSIDQRQRARLGELHRALRAMSQAQRRRTARGSRCAQDCRSATASRNTWACSSTVCARSARSRPPARSPMARHACALHR